MMVFNDQLLIAVILFSSHVIKIEQYEDKFLHLKWKMLNALNVDYTVLYLYYIYIYVFSSLITKV